MNWKPISDGDQEAKKEVTDYPEMATPAFEIELNIHTAYMRLEATIQKEEANYTTLENQENEKKVLRFMLLAEIDRLSFKSDRDTGLMEESNHRTEAGIVQKRT